MIKGSLSHELEVALPADELWEVYGGLRLGQLSAELLPGLLAKVDVEQGDGGVGTVLRLTFAPGLLPGIEYYKEKFVKIDDEKRLKETLVVEGGFLNLGFSSYLVRLEVLEKSIDSSIIKSSIEYEIDEEHKANVSFVSTGGLAAIAEAVSKHLIEKKANAS